MTAGNLASYIEPNHPYEQENNTVFLLGYPISHSISPLVHMTCWKTQNIKWKYSLSEHEKLEPCLSLLDQDDTVGAAVTMPFKVQICAHVDVLSDEANIIGSINTIYKRKDAVTGQTVKLGTNTDCYGIRDAFLSRRPDIIDKVTTGQPGMVIGGGGTSRAAIYALWTWFGVREIYLVNRFRFEIDEIIQHFTSINFPAKLIPVSTPQQAEKLEVPAIIVSAVPCFEPKLAEEKVARETVLVFLRNRKKGYLLEMCYLPIPETKLFKLAQSNLWNVIPGTSAMLYQAIAQQVLWNEKEVNSEAFVKVRQALTKAFS